MMKTALISKIQHYSTKDGPGLRTTVFFMGCNLKCVWCANPENLKSRKRVFYFKERCQHCGLCVKHAENNSIRFSKVGCIIDRERCTNLIDMVDLCPYDAYELVGKEMTAEELVKKLLRDKEFYEIGQGGVTFSGGEAALWDEFLFEVCEKLRKEKVHICLDTAGLIAADRFEKLVNNVDMVLFDIKALDDEIHKKCTSVSNKQILENAKLLAERNIPTIVRLVIVPEYNDDERDLKARIDFVTEMGECVKQVDFLKYHIYGIGKYEKLDETYPMEGNLQLEDAFVEKICEYARAKGLQATVGG